MCTPPHIPGGKSAWKAAGVLLRATTNRAAIHPLTECSEQLAWVPSCPDRSQAGSSDRPCPRGPGAPEGEPVCKRICLQCQVMVNVGWKTKWGEMEGADEVTSVGDT